jgi:hypothetical protein
MVKTNIWSISVVDGMATIEVHNGTGGNRYSLSMKNDEWRDLISILDAAMQTVDNSTIEMEDLCEN